MSSLIRFIGLGWKIRLQKKGKSYCISLAKEIILGNLLKTGDDIHYYLIEVDGRKALLTFLDKKPLESQKEILVKDYKSEVSQKIPLKVSRKIRH